MRPIELVYDSEPSGSDSLRPLLHSRLILFGVTFLGVWLARALLSPLDIREHHRATGLASPAAMLLALLVLCRIRLSLGQLRALELVQVGIWCLRNLALEHVRVAVNDDPSAGLEHSHLPWFILIVAYGIAVPTSWKRCLLVTLAVAVQPLWFDITLKPNVGRDQVLALVEQLGAGVALSLFVAVHLNRLTAEAFQARKLGRYYLKRKLGVGGMGEVYLAEHELLHRPCAVKVIRSDRITETNLRRFEREVQATAQLSNGNIVRVLDFGRAGDGTFFCVMEYLPGMDLERFVSRYGPMACSRVVHVLRQVCSALREAHAAGLVHRDIKPTNIILCEQGQVFDVAKLVDFGLVQEHEVDAKTGRLTQEKVVVGTPRYMSPEQIAGKAIDGRSDLYSLGAVAYFLLVGQPPFLHEDYQRLFAAHLTEPVPPLRQRRPDIPPDVEGIILRCLDKQPDQRYQDARSLEAALATCSVAGQWTGREAEAWWREYVDDNALP